jgi:large exoprotein involved in heme utilization and adhesion
VSIEAPRLVLADGAEIVGNTSLPGAGGSVVIDVNELRISNARIASESTATGVDAGAAGAIHITADDVALDNLGRVSAATVDGAGGTITIDTAHLGLVGGAAITAASSGAGAGGDIVLLADSIDLADSSMSASSTNSGNAGSLSLTAGDTLRLIDSQLLTSAGHSAGGDIGIEVGHSVHLTHSSISAAAGGVTPPAGGGNVSIDPDFVILDQSNILASANAGNGGNITIRAGFFVASAGSAIDASSSSGLDGEVLVDSPNEITGSVLALETPQPSADGLLSQNCVPRIAEQRSTLTVLTGNRGASAGDYLPSPAVPAANAPAGVAHNGQGMGGLQASVKRGC